MINDLILLLCRTIKLHLLNSLLKNIGRLHLGAHKKSSPHRSAPAFNHPGHPLLNLHRFTDPSCAKDPKAGHNIVNVASQICLSRVQDFIFVLVKLDKSCWALPPDSLWQPCPPVYQLHLQVGIICQSDQGALFLLCQVTGESITQDGSQDRTPFPTRAEEGYEPYWLQGLKLSTQTSCFMQNALSVSHTSPIFKLGVNQFSKIVLYGLFTVNGGIKRE